MKRIIIVSFFTFCYLLVFSQFSIKNNRPEFSIDNQLIISASEEGLWSIASGWENDWMTNWSHANPTEQIQSGEWTVLKGKISFPEGDMLLRDSYRETENGLIQCIRRFEWLGKDTLRHATLSVRFKMKGSELKPLIPGVLYYGNSMGAKVNPNIIPVYTGQEGEFAIFEDHRYPMPFVMLENATDKLAAAVHTTPSPVRGAVLSDQWWSMGVEAKDGHTEFVLYSGPIGYNNQHSVAKALQKTPMRYTDTYLNIEPGRIIEKEFFIELYPIEREGSGFQQPLYTSLDLYKPYDANRFTDFQDIIESKYKFAKSRWIEDDGAVGFGMYDLSRLKDIVMGWCGQADSPGFALQVLEDKLEDSAIQQRVQASLDYLTTYPINEDGTFPVGFNVKEKKYHGGDHVSCGQAMYNFAKAIETAHKNGKYNTKKWEEFLQVICDKQSERILNPDWNPYSTAEGFYIAPLAIASKLFNNETYQKAAIKAGEEFAERHLTMSGCYWGGTLDATCEDKEGSWAAFQGFLELYERFGDKKYLDWAKHAMDVCLSYLVIWDIPLPAGRMADYNFKTTGWTVVSPQNQHIDVYGVLFAPEVYKMGMHLKDERLKQVASVMYRSCFQLTDPFGSQGEQLQQTNFAQHGDMSNVHKLRGGYSESWTVFWITAHFLNAAARFVEIGVTP
ncbi:hypothetical protein [Dysgonomonas sp. Marseille-P4361]|uniref:hypothetical protein n=1 Tax=Dysgonomonas sp. Marseille-P4361 TaxID=2161820 RepID=UPI00135813B6|nr:hypothetical protein [Dysgonomonas sp. Marseille-P4361]